MPAPKGRDVAADSAIAALAATAGCNVSTSLQTASIPTRKEVKRMKKPLTNEALLKEAAFWDTIKKAAETSPAKSCLK